MLPSPLPRPQSTPGVRDGAMGLPDTRPWGRAAASRLSLRSRGMDEGADQGELDATLSEGLTGGIEACEGHVDALGRCLLVRERP